MSKLGVSDDAAVLGRASYSGNMPSIKSPLPEGILSNTIKKPSLLSPRFQGSEPIKMEKETPRRYIMTEQSLDNFERRIGTLISNCKSLAETNSAPIISELELVEEAQVLRELFKPFKRECITYLTALKNAEKTQEYVSSKALEMVVFPFVQKWNQFVLIVRDVKSGGIESMNSYINVKFRGMDNIIRDIGELQRRDSVHITSVKKASDSLRELLEQIRESITELLDDSNFGQLTEKSLEGRINDMKSFQRVYSSVHFSEFLKSGFSQSELVQFKANVQTGCNDIMDGLRAAFVFYPSMDKVKEDVSDIHKHLSRVTKQMKLPQTLNRTVRKILTVRDEALTRKRGPGMARVREFVEGDGEPDTEFVVTVKVEQFMREVSGELGMELDMSQDLLENLRKVKSEMMGRIKAAKELEKEFEMFQDKVKTQSSNITTLMKRYNAKESENAMEKSELNHVIGELEERNVEILRQRNEALETAKRREEQFYKIRMKFNESLILQTLEIVTERIAKFLNLQIVDRNNINKWALELSETLIKRGCLNCKRKDELLNETRRRLQPALPQTAVAGETTPSLAASVVAKFEKTKHELTSMTEYCHKLEGELETMKKGAEEIARQSAEHLQIFKRSFEGKTAQEISASITKSFAEMVSKHKIDMASLESSMKRQHSEELSNITKELLVICPMTDVKTDEDITSVMTKLAERVKEQYQELTKKNEQLAQENAKVKSWLLERSGSTDDSLSSEHLMMKIDTAENPLTQTVLQHAKATHKLQSEIALILAQIKGIMRYEDGQDPSTMSIPEIVDYSQLLIEKLHDNIETTKRDFSLQGKTLIELENELGKIYSQLNRCLGRCDPVPATGIASQVEEMIDRVVNNVDNVSVSKVNELTSSIRNILGIDSLNPMEYIPTITNEFIVQNNSLGVVRQFEDPLAFIFRSFDFEFGSYSDRDGCFSDLRSGMMKLHDLMAHAFKGDLNSSVVTVLTRLVSLSSALFGYINS